MDRFAPYTTHAHRSTCRPTGQRSDVFAQWQSRIRNLLTTNGFADDRAQRLATLSVAAIEGAVILCRAGRTDTPLDDVVTEIKTLLTPA